MNANTLKNSPSSPNIMPEIIGHQGVRNDDFLGNDLDSIHEAKRQGATWIEIDVMLTKDKHLILTHDKELNTENNGYKKIRDLSLDEILKIKNAKNEKVATLSETLILAKKLGLGINIEIKRPDDDLAVETARQTMTEIEKNGFADGKNILVSSFSQIAIAEMKRLNRNIPRGYLQRFCGSHTFRKASLLEAAVIGFDQRFLFKYIVKQAKKEGFQVAAFTVNDPKRKAVLKAWGVDSFFTDVPEKMIKNNILSQKAFLNKNQR